jgi:hypothetical protein
MGCAILFVSLMYNGVLFFIRKEKEENIPAFLQCITDYIQSTDVFDLQVVI